MKKICRKSLHFNHLHIQIINDYILPEPLDQSELDVILRDEAFSKEIFFEGKFNLDANPDYRAEFAEQLERLNMEYIDFCLLHGMKEA